MTESKPIAIARPAATLILTRPSPQNPAKFEILMLRRSADTGFAASTWVFPGGRIDPEDFPGSEEELLPHTTPVHPAVVNAAVRETQEECGLDVRGLEMRYFAHWTTPIQSPKRYATWFLIAEFLGAQRVQVDDWEIVEHIWLLPAEAVSRHEQGMFKVTPPIYMTLLELSEVANAADLPEFVAQRQPPIVLPQAIERDGQRLLYCLNRNSNDGAPWRERFLAKQKEGMKLLSSH